MQDAKGTEMQLAETSRTIIVAPNRSYAVPLAEKQRHTSELLGWNDSIIAGTVTPSTRKQYTEDFFDYLRFATDLKTTPLNPTHHLTSHPPLSLNTNNHT